MNSKTVLEVELTGIGWGVSTKPPDSVYEELKSFLYAHLNGSQFAGEFRAVTITKHTRYDELHSIQS
jgi:hypothetical protein